MSDTNLKKFIFLKHWEEIYQNIKCDYFWMAKSYVSYIFFKKFFQNFLCFL